MGYIKITGVTFNPTPISPKVLTVRHRLTSDPDVPLSYTTDSATVDANTDGTFVQPFWILNLLNGTSYTVKIDSNCGNYSFQKAFITTCNCPAGFTANAANNKCVKVETLPPTITYSNYCLAISRHSAYNARFARIYNAGWNNGSIAMVSAPVADVFAEMSNAPQWKSNNVATDGAMNRDSVWIDSNCDGVKDALSMGSQTTIVGYYNNTGTARTVYVGIGADNQFVLKVNGTTIAQTTVSNSDNNYRVWHIFPVTINVGDNFFNAVATGDQTTSDAIGMVVYDNTPAQIRDATADNQLSLLFKSRDLVGTHIDIATCQAGYSLDVSGGQGNYICRKITYADCQSIII